MSKDEVIERIKLYEIPTEQLIKIDSRLHIYVDEVLNNSFFEKVTYKGAFDGTNDWTAGWTNWDPQNTEY